MAVASSITAYECKERNRHCSHVINGWLYIWGGEQLGVPVEHASPEKMEFCLRVEKLSLITGEWSQHQAAGTPPLAIVNYASAVVSNDIYYFGGFCPHGIQPEVGCYHNSLHRLNVVTLNWSECTPTSPSRNPMKKKSCGMAAININGEDYLLVVGGVGPANDIDIQYNGALYKETHPGSEYVRTNEVHYYSITVGNWMSVNSIGKCPPPSSGFTLTSISDENRLIMFGGKTTKGITNNVYIGNYELTAIHWQKIKPTSRFLKSPKWPNERYGHATTLINEHHLLVIGGTNGPSFIDDCWIFNINNWTWKKCVIPKTTVTERVWHSLSVWNVDSCTAWAIEFGGGRSGSAYLSDTAIIELKCNDAAEWYVHTIFDCENYEEKMKKTGNHVEFLYHTLQFKEMAHQEERNQLQRQIVYLLEQNEILQVKNYQLNERNEKLEEQYKQLEEENAYFQCEKIEFGTIVEENESRIESLTEQLRAATLPRRSLHKSSTFPPFSYDNDAVVTKLKEVVNNLLRIHHADFEKLPLKSLPSLANNLFANNLITEAVRDEAKMSSCIDEFKASLNILNQQSQIEDYLTKFLKSFTAVGGSYYTTATVLREHLIEDVKNNCNINIELN